MSVGRVSTGARRRAVRRRRPRPDVVVKLGGSLLSDRARMEHLLAMVCDSPAKVLVVPGGGPFADAVRAAHAAHGFSEAAAHEMAVLATHQTGLLIGDLARAIAPVTNEEELAAAFFDGQQAVALASGFIADADDLPRTWQATSDTIAAWLAVEFDVPLLAYVKSCAVAGEADASELAARGVLDPVCGSVFGGSTVDVRVFGAGDDARFKAFLNGGEPDLSGGDAQDADGGAEEN